MDKPELSYPKILAGNPPQTLGELFSNKSRWVKGSSGLDALSNSVGPTQAQAVRWCVSGGIELLYDDTPKAEEVREALLSWIRAHLPEGEDEDGDGISIMSWNDDPRTTFKDIRKAIVETNS